MAGYFHRVECRGGPVGPDPRAVSGCATGRHGRFAQAATTLLTCLIGAQAHAFGLGDPSVASSLGQPLQMTVPLVGDPDVELSQECVRLVSGSEGTDQIPALGAARVMLEPGASQLRIESAQTIQEPVLRIVVEVGCAQRIRREFTLLMDPPALSAPVADAARATDTSTAEVPIGLGMAQISAVLGQRLSLKVPVTGTQAGSLNADCVQLADPISGEGAPVLRQAHISVGPQDGGAVIEVLSTDSVTEPAVRVVLDVGCVEPLRREYAILLGLPPLASAGETDSRPAQAVASEPEAHARSKDARAAKTAPKAMAMTAPAPPPKAVAAAPAPAQPPVTALAPITEKAPQRSTDRLVLSSTADATAGVDAQAAQSAQNAELVRRMDEMSHQLKVLSSELAASRTRVQELERNASESREVWTWLLGALGGVLLGAALALAWRHRHSVAPAWESVAAPAPSRDTEAAPPARTQRSGRAVAEIGGRATMAQAPTTLGAATEPTLPDDRPTEITVTELHDTVQVIKELYASVLERSTTGSGADSRPQRPLELDLNSPTVGNGIGSRIAARPASAAPAVTAQNDASDPAQSAPQTKVPLEMNTAGRASRLAGGDTQALRRRASDQASQEERFTELPTEMGIDLDLGSILKPVTQDDAATLNEPSALASSPILPSTVAPVAVPARDRNAIADAADASSERVAFKASLTWREPVAPSQGPGRAASGELPALASGAPFPEENLTQSPTELSIDLDVGEPSRLSTGSPPPAAPVLPLSRIGAARSKGSPPALAPIDLQLESNQGEPRKSPREDRRA